jgi:hypothetical protein
MRVPSPRFSGRLFPNGEFGVSRLKEIGLGLLVRPLITNEFHQSTLRMVQQFGFWGAIALLEAQAIGRKPSSLNLSNVSNSHSSPEAKRRGSSGLTRHGGRILRNAGFLLEETVPKELCSFMTITLPSLSETERETVGHEWSEMTRVLLQRVRRHLLASGLPGEVFGCTEIQPKRLEETGGVYLHLHWVFQGRKKGETWAIRVEDVKVWWREILEGVIGRSLLVLPRVEMVPIRKSVAGYIAKYVAKAGGSVARAVEMGLSGQLPSSWYVCSMATRNLIKERTVQGFSLCDYLVSLCDSAIEGAFIWKKKIMIEFSDGNKICVGYAGKLTTEYAEMAREIHRYVRSLPDCASIAS